MVFSSEKKKKKHILIGFYSSSIMYLEPRGYDSILRDKNQVFGANLVKVYMCYMSVIGGCHKRNRIATGGDNSPNDEAN